MDAAFQELLDEFLLEAQERTDAVETALLALRANEGDPNHEAHGDEHLAQIRRELHTLKGNAGMMGFTGLQQLAHRLEDHVEALDRSAPDIEDLLVGVDTLREQLREKVVAATNNPAGNEPAVEKAEVEEHADEIPASTAWTAIAGNRDGSIRVPFGKIDHLVEMLAETLIFRNRLTDAIDAGHARAAEPAPAGATSEPLADWEQVDLARQDLNKTLNELQTYVTELGMVPLRLLFRSLKRIVHDESLRANKRVRLDVIGGDTPIDKALLEVAADALGHLVRNAIIHGIEAPDVRIAKKKPELGTIRLSAAIEGGEVRIEVEDDGNGIDLEALRARAPNTPADEAALLTLVFEEGISTQRSADLSAGRGVGLAAVKKSVEGSTGRVEVRSRGGLGCTFSLRLPLTASIIRSILVAADGERYAVPLVAVEETVAFDGTDLHRVNHALVLRKGQKITPLVDLGVAYQTTGTPRRTGYAVLVTAAGRRRAIAVDKLVGIRDIVVKLLDPIVGRPIGISGSTILGDGRVIMILDPTSLVTIPPFLPAQRDE